jgi:hypothetical protein
VKLPRVHLGLAIVAALAFAGAARADLTEGMKKGTPDIKSISALTFGPEGILFVGDPQGSALFAIATEDTKASDATKGIEVADINEKLASLLGIESSKLRVSDLAINPASTNAYLAVTRGTGRDAAPALVRVERGTNKVAAVELKDVPFSKVELPNGNDKRRQEAITSLGYAGGKLYVAGISNEEFASTLRAIPFPFKEADRGAGIQIYHGAHGALETRSPVQTFTPFDIKGETHLLAAYTCTPLVKIPVSELKAGAKVKGTTVAELGNRNKPLDMVVYEKEGKRYVLIANTSRGVMKVSTEDIADVEPITKRVGGGGTAGLKYETIKDLKNVQQLAKLDNKQALILTQAREGGMNLNTIELP